MKKDKCTCLRFNSPSHTIHGNLKTDTTGYSDRNVVKEFAMLLEQIPQGINNEDGELIYAKFRPQIGDKMFIFKRPLADAIAGDYIRVRPRRYKKIIL